MHMERLRNAKPAVTIQPPKKQSHMQHNLKRELGNLGKHPTEKVVTVLCFRAHERDLILKPNFAAQNASY